MLYVHRCFALYCIWFVSQTCREVVQQQLLMGRLGKSSNYCWEGEHYPPERCYLLEEWLMKDNIPNCINSVFTYKFFASKVHHQIQLSLHKMWYNQLVQLLVQLLIFECICNGKDTMFPNTRMIHSVWSYCIFIWHCYICYMVTMLHGYIVAQSHCYTVT